MKNACSASKNLLVILLLCTGWMGGAQAEKADRDKPMNIEADALRHDDLRQISTFTGKVVLTKGSITVRGARIDVRQDTQGYQYGVITAEPGQRAFYRQKREGVDEFIEGEAEVVEYDGKADNIKLIRKAELRRFKGSTLNDHMTGNLIVYENLTDVFTVDSSAAHGTPASGGGRVKAMLTPNVQPDPAAPVPAPANLRQSATLGGGSK